jgi:Cytidylyltransferase-like
MARWFSRTLSYPRAMAGVGAYPGSFNPPTVAHLAVAEAAIGRAGLVRVDFVVSRRTLGKETVEGPDLEDRLAVLEAMARTRPWLGVLVTESQLIVDVAEGYDAVIVGADKWAQVVDPVWYGGSATARDAAVSRLPRLLLAPRGLGPSPVGGAGGPGLTVPDGIEVLDIDRDHALVSSTATRAGRRDWMAPEAAAFDAESGAWSDPDRYARWRSARRAGGGEP